MSSTLRLSMQAYNYYTEILENSNKIQSIGTDFIPNNEKERKLYNFIWYENKDKNEKLAHDHVVQHANWYLRKYIERADIILEAAKGHIKNKETFDMFEDYYKNGLSFDEVAHKYDKKVSTVQMRIKRAQEAIFNKEEPKSNNSSLTSSENLELFRCMIRSYKLAAKAYYAYLDKAEQINLRLQGVSAVKINPTGIKNNPDERRSEEIKLDLYETKNEYINYAELCLGLVDIFDKWMSRADRTDYSLCKYPIMRAMLDKSYVTEFINEMNISLNYNKWVSEIANQVITDDDVRTLIIIVKGIATDDELFEKLRIDKLKECLDKIISKGA